MKSTPQGLFFCLLGLFFITITSCEKEEKNSVALYEELWNDFNETYPYFTEKNVDWQAVYSKYFGKIANETDQSTLASDMALMLEELRDIHIVLQTPSSLFQYSKRDLFPRNPRDYVQHYIGDTLYHNGRVLYALIGRTQIGYLQISNFEGSVNNYINFPEETILSSLKHRTGLIIDIRDNGGGQELFASDFASHFIDEPSLYKYTRKRSRPQYFSDWTAEYLIPSQKYVDNLPIVLLTNRGTYSAAENFLLMMKNYGNTVVVGDTTGGSSGLPSQRYLSNGWTYTIPTVQVADKSMKIIEDQGVAPDVSVQMTRETIADRRDVILESAIEFLK